MVRDLGPVVKKLLIGKGNSYIVRDDDPLVVVDDLLVVGAGGVPTVSLAEGDGVAGPGGIITNNIYFLIEHRHQRSIPSVFRS